MGDKISSIHLHIQRRLLEYCDYNNCIFRKEIEDKIHRIRIKKIIIPAIIKELEAEGLIKKINRDKFEIININRSRLIEDSGKLYHKIGLF